MKSFTKFIVSILILSLIGNVILLSMNHHKEIEYRYTHDTIVKTKIDTITLTNIEYRDKTIKKVIKVKISDTIRLKDTIYCLIPTYNYFFKTKDADIWASGYKVEIDSLNVFKKIEYKYVEVPVIPKPKKWVVSGGVFTGFDSNGPVYGIGFSLGYKLYEF
jgi:hypothetical protein